MGIGSSLLQFVESLRENRPLPPDAPRTPPVQTEAAPPVRGPDPLSEVAVAVRGSRQRLEALASRVNELKARAAAMTGPGGGAGTPSPSR